MITTREAIERRIRDGFDTPDRAGNDYDRLSDLIGHDLADVINLGLAVLSMSRHRVQSASDPLPSDYVNIGRNLAIDLIFERAGVEGP